MKRALIALLILAGLPLSAEARTVLVDLAASGQRCAAQEESIRFAAARKRAEEAFPNLVQNVERIAVEKTTGKYRAVTSRPQEGMCTYEVEVDDALLQAALRRFPPPMNQTPVAALIRFVRNGTPVPGSTSEASKASDMFLNLLDRSGARPLELVGLGEGFQKLAFFDAGKCQVTDGGIDYNDPRCQVTMDYDTAKTLLLSRVKAFVDDRDNLEHWGPQLAPFTRCAGLVVFGEVRTEWAKDRRDAVSLTVQLNAYDQRTQAIVAKHDDSVPRDTQGVSSMADVEAQLMREVLQDAVNRLAKKVAQSGQYGNCQ